MHTDFVKRFIFVISLFLFIAGCIFLIFFTIAIQHIEVSIAGIFVFICHIIIVVLLFYMSIKTFIKYGMLLGIDYAIEQQKPMTMKDSDNRIVRTSEKKQMDNS